MGWRFRRFFGIGPLRWSLNKTGVGWSIGIPGVRYGVSPNGNRHISIGIPGTGLYWMKNLGVASSMPNSAPPLISAPKKPRLSPSKKQKRIIP